MEVGEVVTAQFARACGRLATGMEWALAGLSTMFPVGKYWFSDLAGFVAVLVGIWFCMGASRAFHEEADRLEGK